MSNLRIVGLETLTRKQFKDDRGSFERLYDLAWDKDVSSLPKQVNLSRNSNKGTLRGMHYQLSGEPEHKLITLLSGSIYLVVVDLRSESESYLVLNTFEV